MIYFKKDLIALSIEIIKTKKKTDIMMDLLKITYIMTNSTTIKVWEIQSLDKELRKKYPIIEKMLNSVSQPIIHPSQNFIKKQTLMENDLLEYLKQDYFGILLHVLIEEKIIHEISAFIERLE